MDKRYNFEWNPINGLRYVSDKNLEIAYKLIEKANMNLRKEEINGKDKIVLTSNIIGFCDYKTTTDELYNILTEGIDKLDNKEIFLKETSEFTTVTNININTVCVGCKFDACPKRIATYIKYLQDQGELEDKLKDRDEFRKNNVVNDKFEFNWDIEEGLRNVPDRVYNFCKKQVEKGYVFVDNILNNNGYVVIRNVLSCNELRKMDFKEEKLSDDNIKIQDLGYYNLERKTKMDKIGFCNTYNCRLILCPLVVSGYIYYLQRLGKFEQIEADRNYYYEHQKEIDDELLERKNEKIKELEGKKEDYKAELEKYRNKTTNLDDIIEDIIMNKTQNNLHCIIEGEDDEIKNDIIKYIEKSLVSNEKIDAQSTIKISMQNFAAKNVYEISLKSDRKDINGEFYQSQCEVKYTEIEKSKLYILNKVEEFINDYELYRDGKYQYKEIRKKQFDHAIDLLTKMDKGNYIIINGTKEEIDKLLELEPKLQFIYQNYRYTFKDLSIDEIFNLFVDNIRPEIIDELKENIEKYKKEFEEYVSLNQKFIPFSNRDLANYLAMYCNTKGKIVFPENMYKKETVEESLNKIIGLNELKENIKKFENYMLFQIKARANGINLADTNMHMIFTGNPGTGKTTIARIMAKMLFDLGMIKENKLIEVERKDLVGEYIGQTAPKTNEVIEKAMGGVLFIDEAYSLAPKDVGRDFGQEAISTLIKAMEDQKDNLVVIFAGYKDEMKTFIDSNPGIASRVGYTFDFPDYTSDELTKMFFLKMKNMGFKCDKNIEAEIKNICSYFSRRKAFGNGRFIDKLMQEVIMKHSLNNYKNINEISIEDIPTIEELNNYKVDNKSSIDNMLKNIIGMKEIKEKIKEYEQYVKFIKTAENEKIHIPSQNMHMIFTGNPGTGKTTIARIMAKMLFDLGVIKENKLVEVERKDLIAGYVGQTAPKTAEVIEKAMGGVLFIDEAYSLCIDNGGQHDFGQEAIATLIKAMEDYKDSLVVIFAGYKDEMKKFVDSNPGIASRIGYTFNFPDYTDEELTQILYKKIKQCNLNVSDEAKEPIDKLMKYFCNVDNIGNGRFADKVLQEILLKHSKNIGGDIKLISKDDIPTINEITKVVFNGNTMINPEKITKSDLKRTAVHEIGHAAVRLLLFKKPGIKKITINPEGTGTLGYVSHENTSGYVRTKTELLNEIKVLLAGMASEEIYLGEYANGNGSDLEKATRIANSMITYSGMSKVGLGQIQKADGEMSKIIQEEINRILESCFKDVKDLIKNNQYKMNKVVDILLKNKEIDEKEFIENFK